VTALLSAIGLVLVVLGKMTLGRSFGVVPANRGVVVRGPYALVRHPIYTGLLVMALGTALDLGQLRCWLALPLMASAFWIKLKQEERLLLRHFPQEYPIYKKQVKALVPFVI